MLPSIIINNIEKWKVEFILNKKTGKDGIRYYVK